MKVQGGKMVPVGRTLHRGDQQLELSRAMEAAQLVERLQEKIQQLRMMGSRDADLDAASQKARETADAIGRFLTT